MFFLYIKDERKYITDIYWHNIFHNLLFKMNYNAFIPDVWPSKMENICIPQLGVT